MKYNQISEGAIWFYDRIFSQPTEGLKKQVLITYYEAGGNFHVETVTRNYYGVNDYQDSVSHEVF